MELTDYHHSWKNKPVLRAIYSDLYSKITDNLIDGDTLEIGGGIGNFQIEIGNLVRTDIQVSSTINVAADAQCLPFKNNAFSNIVLFDVLHHLQCPMLFFAEAKRVLIPGGKIVMIEPGITPISGVLYKLGHEEPVDMRWLWQQDCRIDHDKDPYESNQAIPTIMFRKRQKLFLQDMPGLKINQACWLSMFAYPLSGGFKKWSLLPVSLVKFVLYLEKKLLPVLGWLLAFRLLVVLENT